MRARLIGSSELAPEVRHFEFEVLGGTEFTFVPGQFVSVKEQVAGREITRAYSIASPPDGNRFALCLNRVEDGMVSPLLFSMQPGEELEIQEPLGYFTLRHPDRRAVLVATGTGIAPFRSILFDHLPKRPLPMTLLFGVRYEDGLLYRSEWERLAAEYPAEFRFLPTITRPGESWQGRTGRVQTHLDEALNLASPDDLANVDVYVCGLKEMVDDVRTELKRRGFDRKQIVYEKYD